MAKKNGQIKGKAPRKTQPKPAPEGKKKELPTRTGAKAKPAKTMKAPPFVMPSMPAGADEENKSPELTRAGRALLAVCMNPQFFKSKHPELYGAAQISRTQFYRLWADPAFQQLRRDAQLSAIGAYVAPLLEVSFESAQLKGRDGFQDRKLIFEMARVYTPATKIEATLSGPSAEGELPDEELVFMYLAAGTPRHLWLPGIRQRYELGQITPAKPRSDGVAPGGEL